MNTLKRKIFKVEVKHIVDADPNTAWLGEYGNTPTSKYAIERGNAGPRESRYFNPPWENYMGVPDADIRKYCQQDYTRVQSLERGDWYFIGIQATAEVGISHDGGKNFKLDTLTSGGSWGIESDSDATYLQSVEDGELSNLKTKLLAYGFGRSSAAKAIKEATRNTG